MRSAWVAVAGAAVLTLVVGCSPETILAARSGSARPSASPAAAARLPVLGYQAESDPIALIDSNAAGLGSVGVDGVDIGADGRSVDLPDSQARGQLAAAHAHGKPAELLVGNYSEAAKDFDETVAHRLLASPANIDHVVAALRDTVVSQGWDGIDIDLESLAARDASGMTDFVHALRRALPKGKTLSIAVTNYTKAADYPANGWDLAAIGKAVDRVVLMAYDQHSSGTAAGPIGELPWQEAGLSVVAGLVGRHKVDLGVAGYGCVWPAKGAATQIGDRRARELVSADGAKATYDTTAGEWHATLSDGSVLWWSDARSLAERRALAAKRGVHGLAVWSLGLSDPLGSATAEPVAPVAPVAAVAAVALR